MVIFDALDQGRVIGLGDIKMHMLDEIVSDEVARRCALRGVPAPWQMDAFEDEQVVAATDHFDPGAA
jgi:hypothetical protein